MGKGKPQVRIYTLIRCLMLFIAVTAGSIVAVTDVHAQSQAAPSAPAVEFDIPAGELIAALDRFAEQSGLQVVSGQSLQRIKVSALRGSFTPEEALGRLLQGSGFTCQRLNAQTFVLKQQPAPSGPKQRTEVQHAPDVTQSPEQDMQNMESITVTGTRIRGGNTPSPVITIGSENIQEEGFTNLGQVIRSIPQNFGGGQNPGVAAGAWAGSYYNENITGGSAANLRGIGQDATLTLLNGRRMSYGGYGQAVDISAIPVQAVDRIEILTDGASAIYGSDAVGGVINVMLRRDFDGVAIGARYGEAMEGGLATHEYTATAGSTWSTGGMIATWRKASNDPIYADQRDYTQDMYDPSSLYQRGDVRSGLLSMHQSFGDSIEIHLDTLRTERDKHTVYGYATYYLRYPADTTTSLISPGITFSLSNDWSLNVGAAFGRDETNFNAHGIDKATGAAILNSSYTYGNESRIYEADAEGPLFTLPGGAARLAIGVGYRDNEFLYLFNNSAAADGDEGSRFAYAELNLPVVSASQNVAGVRRLELTGAVRAEDYDSYGRVRTPKIGLIYSPSDDLTLKVSWGKSFKAPTLYQTYVGQFSYLYPATAFGGAGYAPDAAALYLNGGNLALKPERARTWSASIAFRPEALPGMEAELTGFHIDYTDRILPPITSSSEVLSSSIYDEFVIHRPTAEEQAEVIASTEFSNYAGSPYAASSVVAIIDNRFVNAARQRIKGIDLSGSYRFDLAMSRLAVRGSISWLDSEQALTSTAMFSNAAGILFYPAKVSSRVGAVWSQDGYAASIFGNYKSGVTNTVDGTNGASFTTFDLALRYDTGEGEGILADMAFEASAQNLLNREPPLYVLTSLDNAPYDSTNYSAIGRYLSLSISKHW